MNENFREGLIKAALFLGWEHGPYAEMLREPGSYERNRHVYQFYTTHMLHDKMLPGYLADELLISVREALGENKLYSDDIDDLEARLADADWDSAALATPNHRFEVTWAFINDHMAVFT